MSILKKPIITEKATAAGEKLGQYGFIVDNNANKVEIKKAVEIGGEAHLDSCPIERLKAGGRMERGLEDDPGKELITGGASRRWLT